MFCMDKLEAPPASVCGPAAVCLTEQHYTWWTNDCYWLQVCSDCSMMMISIADGVLFLCLWLQRVEELEKENALLKSEKEEMNQRILQHSKISEGETWAHPSDTPGNRTQVSFQWFGGPWERTLFGFSATCFWVIHLSFNSALLQSKKSKTEKLYVFRVYWRLVLYVK